jgi:hypothetical protein
VVEFDDRSFLAFILSLKKAAVENSQDIAIVDHWAPDSINLKDKSRKLSTCSCKRIPKLRVKVSFTILYVPTR